jgi:hypothetical protein
MWFAAWCKNKFRPRTPAQMWFVAWCKDKDRQEWFWIIVIISFFVLLGRCGGSSTPGEYQPDCYQEFGGSNAWVCD